MTTFKLLVIYISMISVFCIKTCFIVFNRWEKVVSSNWYKFTYWNRMKFMYVKSSDQFVIQIGVPNIF